MHLFPDTLGRGEEEFPNAAQCDTYLPQRARGCVSSLRKQENLWLIIHSPRTEKSTRVVAVRRVPTTIPITESPWCSMEDSMLCSREDSILSKEDKAPEFTSAKARALQ
jgi:hypothetical protein